MEHNEKSQVQPEELAKLRDEIAKMKELEHECRQAQEALENERSFVSAILDTAAALIVVLDTKGRIVRFNHACERATGYTFDEVKGKSLWDLFILPEEADLVEGVRGCLRQLKGRPIPQ